MKPIAVIILNWNGASLLEEFLPKVVANTSAALADVIVADNGSTDVSLEVLTNRFPEVKVIRYDHNYGFAGGYNHAIADTNYKYSVLLNSDVAPAPGWIEPMYEYMEAHAECGGCQPKLLSYKEPSKFEYAGGSGGFIDRNGYPYCRGRIFADVETDSGQYDDIVPIHWATGAALMVRTKLYVDAGGLDELFFAHMEEIDLCWRIRLMGYTLVAVPQGVAYHLGGGSLPASDPRKTYLNFRNNLLLLYKNLPARKVGRMLVKRRLLDTLAFVKFVLTLDFGNARAILRAHRDYRKMKCNYSQTATENLLAGEPNILVAYYLRGVKRYENLKK